MPFHLNSHLSCLKISLLHLFKAFSVIFLLFCRLCVSAVWIRASAPKKPILDWEKGSKNFWSFLIFISCYVKLPPNPEGLVEYPFFSHQNFCLCHFPGCFQAEPSRVWLLGWPVLATAHREFSSRQ